MKKKINRISAGIVVCILLILSATYIITYSLNERNHPRISNLYSISLLNNDKQLYIDFTTGSCSKGGLGTFTIDASKLSDYKEYIISFYNKNRSKSFNNHHEEDVRAIWKLDVYPSTDYKDSNFIVGTDYYPKDWPELIDKTNELIGEAFFKRETGDTLLK